MWLTNSASSAFSPTSNTVVELSVATLNSYLTWELQSRASQDLLDLKTPKYSLKVYNGQDVDHNLSISVNMVPYILDFSYLRLPIYTTFGKVINLRIPAVDDDDDEILFEVKVLDNPNIFFKTQLMLDGTYLASSNALYYDLIQKGASTISIDVLDAVTKNLGEHIEIRMHVLSNAEFIQLDLNTESTDRGDIERESGGKIYTPDFGV